MNSEQLAAAIRSAAASSALEGQALSEEEMVLLREMLEGKRSFVDYVRELRHQSSEEPD